MEMAATKTRSSKKIPAKKSTSKPIKTTAPKKKPAKDSSRKKAAAQKTQPVTQTEFWQRNFRKIQDWLENWWEHGLPEAPLEPPPKSRKKTNIRLHSRRPQLASHPKPARSTASGIHLIGKEEHRCPYCLEEVTSNDARGVKICPICHTYHHADCWAVTGACQVPHYHE
jgi:ribosomal protein L37AE/L43A